MPVSVVDDGGCELVVGGGVNCRVGCGAGPTVPWIGFLLSEAALTLLTLLSLLF